MLDNAWWCLTTLDNKHHPCDQQASLMGSISIIHGINKHHMCYSIIDNIASLIATFKRYALVWLRILKPYFQNTHCTLFVGVRKCKLYNLNLNKVYHKHVNLFYGTPCTYILSQKKVGYDCSFPLPNISHFLLGHPEYQNIITDQFRLLQTRGHYVCGVMNS